jgi:hypothetical protein
MSFRASLNIIVPAYSSILGDKEGENNNTIYVFSPQAAV